MDEVYIKFNINKKKVMTKKLKNQKNNPSLLHFWGEDRIPSDLVNIMNRRSILGDEKIPKELEKMRNFQSVYVKTNVGNKKPEIKVIKTECQSKEDDLWRIDLPNYKGTQFGSYARNGRVAIKQKPKELVKKIDVNVSFNSFLPKWSDGSFTPKVLMKEQHRKLKRKNGRYVDPLYVFGTDDRWSFRDVAWPWGLVGKVITSAGTTGTAALIGGRTIVTAGHMVPWNQDGWWMRFIPAYYDGTSLHGVGVESYVSDAHGYDVDGNVTGYDWAVCRLYEPLGESLGYFGFNGYSTNWNNDPYWSIIGYPGAIASAQRPSFQGNNTVIDTDGDSNGGTEIETRADLTPGNSGGPMFGWWDGDPRLIGVVSGQEEEWSPGFWPWEWGNTELVNVIAGGSGFTNIIAWARTNWN